MMQKYPKVEARYRQQTKRCRRRDSHYHSQPPNAVIHASWWLTMREETASVFVRYTYAGARNAGQDRVLCAVSSVQMCKSAFSPGHQMSTASGACD
eukprot:5981718-Pyramimonas_sp.AAC.1